MPASAPMPALPRLQVTTPAGVKTWADALVNALEIEVRRINALATSAPWSAATPAPVRTLNVTRCHPSEPLRTTIVVAAQVECLCNCEHIGAAGLRWRAL